MNIDNTDFLSFSKFSRELIKEIEIKNTEANVLISPYRAYVSFLTKFDSTNQTLNSFLQGVKSKWESGVDPSVFSLKNLGSDSSRIPLFDDDSQYSMNMFWKNRYNPNNVSFFDFTLPNNDKPNCEKKIKCPFIQQKGTTAYYEFPVGEEQNKISCISIDFDNDVDMIYVLPDPNSKDSIKSTLKFIQEKAHLIFNKTPKPNSDCFIPKINMSCQTNFNSIGIKKMNRINVKSQNLHFFVGEQGTIPNYKIKLTPLQQTLCNCELIVNRPFFFIVRGKNHDFFDINNLNSINKSPSAANMIIINKGNDANDNKNDNDNNNIDNNYHHKNGDAIFLFGFCGNPGPGTVRDVIYKRLKRAPVIEKCLFTSNTTDQSMKFFKDYNFCSDFFVLIDKSFLRDNFNYWHPAEAGGGIESDYSRLVRRGGVSFTDAKRALMNDTTFTIKEEDFQKNQVYKNEENARLMHSVHCLYGLLHAKYILTAPGQERMLEMYICDAFPKCPRAKCRGIRCLPYGVTDQPCCQNVKMFCPNCKNIYNSSKKNVDGAFFGPTYVHTFLQKYPMIAKNKDMEQDDDGCNPQEDINSFSMFGIPLNSVNDPLIQFDK